MAICSKCGSPVEGRFCSKCGARVVATPASSTGAPSQSAAMPHSEPVVLSDNTVAALCYLLLGVTGLLFLVLEPYNRKRSIRFHAFQSLLVTVGLAICWIVVITVGAMLSHIPWIGDALASILFLALFLGGFLLWLLLMIKAYTGQRLNIPLIGPLAEKQA